MCLAMLFPGALARAEQHTPPNAPDSVREAREFREQLEAAAGEVGRLRMNSLPTDAGLLGGRPGSSPDELLLQTKRALEQSNTRLEQLFAPPAPTGDALYDRFAAAVEQQMLDNSLRSEDEGHLATLIPDAELNAWEPEFGADPRYWELRYFCAAVLFPYTELSGGFTTPSQFLAEAVRREIATCNTLLLLADSGNIASWNLPPTLWHFTEQLGVPASDPGVAQEQFFQRSRLAVLNAAVALDPDEAWAYYARAMFWFDEGQQERGLADLQAGNTAAKCSWPYPWPSSAIDSAPLAPQPPGSPAVCGAILSTIVWPYSPLFFGGRCKNHLNESIVCANLTGDMSGLDTWHQFACRIGTSPGQNFDSRMLASLLTGVLRNYFERAYGEQLSAPQLETLQRMRGAYASFRSVNSWKWENNGAKSVLRILDPARGFYLGAYLKECSVMRANAGTAEIFADLSQVHYPELDLPECMRKYEALAP
jgi:hypothetical protein